MSDNSGSAFPRNSVPATVTQSNGKEYYTPFMPAQDGMSLRDYFAAQALGNIDGRGNEENAAKWCYEMADAMLKEREKNGG